MGIRQSKKQDVKPSAGRNEVTAEERYIAMRYAVISDIHGNLPALDAVVEDAERNHTDVFLFAGDYCLGNPYPDGCIARMRALAEQYAFYAVRGNQEAYFERMPEDESARTDGNGQIIYWCHKNIVPENLEFLLKLPNQLRFQCQARSVYMTHSSADFIADSVHRKWSPSKLLKRYGGSFVPPEELKKDIGDYFQTDRQFRERLAELPEGIYIFGHSHIQWNYMSEDCKKVLINPGACGLPVDCVKEGIPYTMLEITDTGEVNLEEKRVPFDMDGYLAMFRKSVQFREVPVWSRLIMKQLETRKEYISLFLQYMEEYAGKTGETQRPFPLPLWEKGFGLWYRAVFGEDAALGNSGV